MTEQAGPAQPQRDPLAWAEPLPDAEVERALVAWRAQARSGPGNVTMLYVAGHGIQTGNEGGILLLQDVGAPDRVRALAKKCADAFRMTEAGADQ